MPDKQLLNRIRVEFLEMPGLRLTPAQVQRLCGIERTPCQQALATLVATKFLCLRPNGTCARFDRGCRPSGWRVREASRRSAGSNISTTLTGEHAASPTAAAPAAGLVTSRKMRWPGPPRILKNRPPGIGALPVHASIPARRRPRRRSRMTGCESRGRRCARRPSAHRAPSAR